MGRSVILEDISWDDIQNPQVDMEAEIAALEEEAAVACKAYDEVVEVRDRLDGEISQVL